MAPAGLPGRDGAAALQPVLPGALAAGDPCGVPSPRDGVPSLREKQGVTPSVGLLGQRQVGKCESRPAPHGMGVKQNKPVGVLFLCS